VSDPTLTPAQALLLFGLLASHGECPQAELNPAVKKADREALVKARLITAGKVGRGLYLKLEDAGWAWAAAHLSHALPPSQRALHEMLARVGEHLVSKRETLAEFIGSKRASAVSPPKKANPAKPKAIKPRAEKPKRAKSEKQLPLAPPSVSDARAMILRAYSEITGGHTGTAVRLADLRTRLPQLDRGTFDAALT
jgi:hypothetical protein